MRFALVLVAWLAAAVLAAEDVSVFAGFEATASPHDLGTPLELDPYDADTVRVDARIVAPDGSISLQPAFWLVPQERWEQQAFSSERKRDVPWERFRDAGPGRWCLRFSPSSAGDWRWTWEVSLHGGAARSLPGGTVTAVARLPIGSGPITVADGVLATRDGSSFIPVGINCAWPIEAGSTVYDHWLDRLASAGGNATRLWLVHYYGGTSLEWSSSGVNAGYAGVGRYSQESGARVDRILADCERRGVRVMLCLYTFGDVNWDWDSNPYSRKGGGWLDDPRAFFTDARARAATKKLLRYEIARWGWSRALWAWELWNEVDTCEGFDDVPVTAWHREMSDEIARLDAHRHPITTDYRFTPPTSDCGAYALPRIAFSQLHTYWPLVPDAFVAEIGHLGTFAKPVVIGEYGLHVEPQSLRADPAGLHLHDGLWGGLFCGSAGGGMGWWWDGYVEPRGLWTHCLGLSRFVSGEDLAGLVPAPAATDAAEAAPALALAARDRAWAWVRNAREVRMLREAISVRVGTYRVDRAPAAHRLTIAAALPGPWSVDFIDPYDGTWLSSAMATGDATGIEIPLPAYRHDLALKLRHVDRTGPPLAGPPAPTPWHDEVERVMEGR